LGSSHITDILRPQITDGGDKNDAAARRNQE